MTNAALPAPIRSARIRCKRKTVAGVRFRVGVTAAVLLLGIAYAPAAETFRFRYQDGTKYRILSHVDEDVVINGSFSHRADILNKIAIEVTDVRDGAGFLEADFQTSERSAGVGSVYEWGQNYESRFWRSAFGEYDIAPEYFMPVVRDVPRFPERDIEVGETWIADGAEVHDLRTNFGIPQAYHFPIQVGYAYMGKAEKDGGEYDLITIEYTVFHRPPPVSGALLYPVRITGYSEQMLYWDNRVGRPYGYTEQFDFVFTLSSGDIVEYIGTAEAYVVESTPMQKEDVAEDIRRSLEESKVEDADVRVDSDGVTVSLENIQFLPDSAVLTTAEKKKLDVIGGILEQYPDRDVLITGHTALAGTEAGRQQLSEERARAVGNYLLSLGVRDADRIITRGMAAREPIARNDTEAGMRRNRRVEIKLLEN